LVGRPDLSKFKVQKPIPIRQGLQKRGPKNLAPLNRFLLAIRPSKILVAGSPAGKNPVGGGKG
jgi:hypothetical protein